MSDTNATVASPNKVLEAQPLMYLRPLDDHDYLVENEGALNGYVISKETVQSIILTQLDKGDMCGEWGNPPLDDLSPKDSTRRINHIDLSNVAFKLSNARLITNTDGQLVLEADALYPEGAPDRPVRYLARAYYTAGDERNRITHIVTWDAGTVKE